MTDARRPDDGETEPARFRDDPGATSLERALLRAGQGGSMPAMERHRVWAAIASQLVPPPSGPAPASGGAGAAGGAAGKVLGAGALKGISVVALVASGAGLWAYQTRDVTTSIVVPAASGSPAVAIVAPPAEAVAPASVRNDVPPLEHASSGDRAARGGASLTAEEGATPPGTTPAHRAASLVSPSVAPSPGARATSAPSGSATPVTAAVPVSSSEPLPAPGSRLSDEAHAVLAARAALRSGNPAAALRELSDASASFPRGALVQEREALTIEALARTGQSGAASARAQAFLRRFPRSPHGDDVRRFIVAR